MRDARAATVAPDASAAAALEARGKADVAANKVVDVYLAEVEIDPALGPRPLHYRERARACRDRACGATSASRPSAEKVGS